MKLQLPLKQFHIWHLLSQNDTALDLLLDNRAKATRRQPMSEK